MTSTHVIRRQFVDVEFEGSEDGALALQHRLLALCQDALGPALQSILDRLVPAQEHWSIDRLDIDAGSFQAQSLERLVEAVVTGVERQLQGQVPRLDDWPPGRIRSRTQTQSVRQAFLYFLEAGVLPWWFRLPAGKTLEEVIREAWREGADRDSQLQYFDKLLGEKIGSSAVRKRLVRQFSTDFLGTLLSSVSSEVASAAREIFTRLPKRSPAAEASTEFSDQIWERAFLNAFAGKRTTAGTLIDESLEAMPPGQPRSVLIGLLEAIWPAEPGRESVPEKVSDLSKAEDGIPFRPDLEEGVFIDCAGVVLLHPFLARFFEGLGIAEGDKLLQPERALCLLHYLATGLRFAPEYDLLLPKLLCNLPVDTAVDSRIELTAAEEEETAALLSAVIRHWDALGSTSAESLRGSFLVRPGKLSQRHGEHLLQLETRSYDVLLDRLPWGLGLVQLPWMERTLWVEWRF